MEKSENRLKYLNELNYFIKSLKINQDLLDKVINHEYFKNYQKLLQELKNDEKTDFYRCKLFILLELTKERSTCAAIIEILGECGQKELAKKLEDYNTSSGLMELSTDIEIKVAKGAAPILGRSNTYTLYKYPRGRCVIINNVEEPQVPAVIDKEGSYLITPKGFKRETLRFEHIFTQLCFKVETLPRLDSNQIKEQMTKISKDFYFCGK